MNLTHQNLHARRLMLIAAAGLLTAMSTAALASGGGGGGGEPKKEEAKPKAKPAPQLPQAKPVRLAGAEPKAPAHAAPNKNSPNKNAAAPSKQASHDEPYASGAALTGEPDHAPAPAGNPQGEHGHTDSAAPMAAEVIPDQVTADIALRLLESGNLRWVNGQTQNPSVSSTRRQQTAEAGQKPMVTILTCADSRLPVERMFDRGVGEIFAIRVAGNVVSGHEAATVEYALEHLKTPVLVVMGHSKCGAVKAAAGIFEAGREKPSMASDGNGDAHTHAHSNDDAHADAGRQPPHRAASHLSSNLQGLIDDITPAVVRASKQNPRLTGDALVEAAVRENVWQAMFDLFATSPEVAAKVHAGEVKVVGAVADISTGQVSWMGEHPWQEAILMTLGNGKGQERLEHSVASLKQESAPSGGQSGHNEPGERQVAEPTTGKPEH